jgi:hypothetical protein
MNKFTIKLMGKVFESNEDGFLDLNEICKGCSLGNNKLPSEWKNKVKSALVGTDNIRVVTLPRATGEVRAKFGTLATEKGAVAYAMWVSVDFYIQVVDSFVALRNGEVEKAISIASDTMSEADAHYLKRQARLKGMFWSEASAYSGITNPLICKQMLLSHPKFNYFDEDGNVNEEDAVATRYFYNRGNKFTKSVRLCVTVEGRKWMRDNSNWFNNATELFKIQRKDPF